MTTILLTNTKFIQKENMDTDNYRNLAAITE